LGKTNKTVPAAYPTPDGCIAIAETLARIGDKWTVLVIASLSSGEPKRYSELRRKLEGISQRMLTLTLKGLEQDGLVTRTMYPTIPPRVDYELTPLGRKLVLPLQALYEWAVQHRPQMLAAREKFQSKQRKAAQRDSRGPIPGS
jgi:DNA-binding HxlR family transcriptional regulator